MHIDGRSPCLERVPMNRLQLVQTDDTLHDLLGLGRALKGAKEGRQTSEGDEDDGELGVGDDVFDRGRAEGVV